MANLARWIERNMEALIETAVIELSQDETMREEASHVVKSFFHGLLRAAEEQEALPLENVLISWVSSHHVPIADDPTGGAAPILTVFKRITWEQIQHFAEPEQVLDLLRATDEIYTQALLDLSRMEINAMLTGMHLQVQEAQEYAHHLHKQKTDFVEVAAHELRTPLTLIEGYVDMIRTTGHISEEDQVALLLDGLAGGIKRLREIIQDMIDVSHINLNTLTLHYQPIWFHQLLETIENHIEEALSERSLDFRIEHHTFPKEKTFGDPQRLVQALHNVVTNAIKFTPDGGQITIGVRELQGFVDVIVRDTGIGIDPADLPHIFEVFSSLGEVGLHSSGKTKFKGGGPGLGLAIAKGIIDAHGGNIWAESDGYDEVTCPGSIFHIMIPIRDELPAEIDHPLEPVD
jgi:signal transduction histidine kinase